MNRTEPLTRGPILRALLALAVPIVLANILQTVYQLTDTFWLGRLGANAVAAVSLSFPVLFLLISFGSGLSVAGGILIAQSYGRGDARSVNHIAAQTFTAVAATAVLLSAAGYYLSEPLMRLFGAGPEVLPLAVEYMQISFLGLIFPFIYFVFQSLLRGVGDVKTPFYVVLGAVLLNFLFDPVLILGLGPMPAMGVGGAAMATIVTQGLAAIVGVVLLFSGKYSIQLTRRDLLPDVPLMKRILVLGAPASVEQSTRALGLSVLVILVTAFGTTTVAAYGIGTRILSFIIIPALGLSMATTTVVGQNVGAGEVERAERTAWLGALIAFVSLTLVGILLFLFARPLTALFIPDSPAVIESGAAFLRIMALSFGFMGVQQVISGAFRGAGQTLAAMVLTAVSLWILRFPVAFVLSARTPLAEAGIWWSFPISNVLAAVIAVAWYRQSAWRRRTAAEELDLQERIHRETIVEEGIGPGN